MSNVGGPIPGGQIPTGSSGRVGEGASRYTPKSEAELEAMGPMQLAMNLKAMGESGQLDKVSLNFLLLMSAKLNYKMKNDELEDLSQSLKQITQDTQTLSAALAEARAESEKDDPGSVRFSRETQDIVDAIGDRLDLPPETIPTNAKDAADLLSRYSKSLTEIAKEQANKAQKARGEYDNVMSAFSNTMKKIIESIKDPATKTN